MARVSWSMNVYSADMPDPTISSVQEQESGAPPIYTIGYGARTIEQFLDLLRRYQVAFLIDVRSQPFSRFQPMFNRCELQLASRQCGIRYVFMGDLLGGRPDDPACYTEGKVDYAKCRQAPAFLHGIARLQKAWHQKQRVALMCSEGKPESCHRTKLIGAALTDTGIPVQHIDEDGSLRAQDEVIGRLTLNQTELFGDTPSSVLSASRRTYRDE